MDGRRDTTEARDNATNLRVDYEETIDSGVRLVDWWWNDGGRCKKDGKIIME